MIHFMNYITSKKPIERLNGISTAGHGNGFATSTLQYILNANCVVKQPRRYTISCPYAGAEATTKTILWRFVVSVTQKFIVTKRSKIMAINLNNIEGLQAAENGVIYEFIEKDGTTNKKVLVVQNDKRTEDNLISILMLGTRKGASDTIPIKIEHEVLYVHCGMITYCKRVYLGKKAGRVSKDTMDRIRNSIAFQLGIENGSNYDYKEMYDHLLNKVVSQGVSM